MRESESSDEMNPPQVSAVTSKITDGLRQIAIGITDILPHHLCVSIRRYAFELAGASVGPAACIYGRQIVSYPERLRLGELCFINADCFFESEGGVSIGMRTRVGPRVMFLTTNHDETSMTSVLSAIHVGNDCWIGAGATLLPGCELEDGTIVASGAVMLGRVHKRGFYAGVPGTYKRDIRSNGGRTS
jgi:acetyltransferase-like isoleucine patch superfamily enzyme